MPDITIRPANAGDIPFIREQYVHVEETGAPPWRQAGPSPYTDAWIEDVVPNAPDEQAILVAIDESGNRLGYTWLLSLTEFDAIAPHGHIAGVAVGSEAAGQGVGRALIAAAEAWCREQGLTEVTLHCSLLPRQRAGAPSLPAPRFRERVVPHAQGTVGDDQVPTTSTHTSTQTGSVPSLRGSVFAQVQGRDELDHYRRCSTGQSILRSIT